MAARKAKPRPRGGVPGQHASPGSGSVYQIRSGARAGAWRGAQVVTLPGGARTRIYVVGSDEATARAELAQRAAAAEGRLIPPSDAALTVSAWLARWLTGEVRLRRRASTYDAYVIQAVHVERYLGGTLLRDLTLGSVGWLLGRLTTEPQPRGRGAPRPLSAASAANVLAVLHNAVRAAVDAGVIASDPIARARPPRRERREYRVIPDDQLQRVLSAAAQEDHPLLLAFELAAATGMRRGEVLGLHWTDIDLQAATILVVRQRTRNASLGVHQAAPKTARGRRRLSFPTALVPPLLAHQESQRTARMAARRAWVSDPFVFIAPSGQPYAPESIDSAWRKLLVRVGVPHVRLHDLRHTWASEMIGSGESLQMVADVLGHSSATVTLGTYSHALPNSQQAAIERRGTAILPPTGPVDVPIAVREGENRAC